MALDHSRLGLKNNFLENKSGRIFCVRQVYLTESCQQPWVRVNQHFILFIHHIWGKTVLVIIQTSDRMQYFTIFQDKLHSVNIQDDQSLAFSETVQKFPKSINTACRFSLLTSAKFALNINRVTLQHNKEFIRFIFYLVVLDRSVIFKSVWYARHFEYSRKRCSWTTENKRHSY